jgi:hypothetical protein
MDVFAPVRIVGTSTNPLDRLPLASAVNMMLSVSYGLNTFTKCHKAQCEECIPC